MGSRWYTELACGCLISCDKGGGLVPCNSSNCLAGEWQKDHPACEWCGNCLKCIPDHSKCEEELAKLEP
jgi:hypothetical protein